MGAKYFNFWQANFQLTLRFMVSALRRILRFIYVKNEMVVLKSPMNKSECVDDFVLLVERKNDPEAAFNAYTELGRNISMRRIHKRFTNGFRFYELRSEGELFAMTWVIDHGDRFIDEVGCHINIPKKSVWIRDLYINTAVRGKGFFKVMLSALSSGPFLDSNIFWSDVSVNNKASIKAHYKYGFEEVVFVSSKHFFGIIMLRFKDVKLPKLNLICYKNCSSLFLTGIKYSDYVKKHMG